MKNQRGNATIYVLIVVALFAALGMILARQNGSSESGHLGNEKADLLAGQILAFPAQIKQSAEMITMTGTDPSDLDFTQPGQTDFNTAPTTKKLFHPDGGGLTLAPLPDGAVDQTTTTPPAGWYVGMFNNVEWTASSAQDVVAVAYQISEEVCQRINKSVTGSDAVPTLGDTIPNLLINKEYPAGNSIHGGTNADFAASECSACEGKPALCVKDSGAARYGFYSIIFNR